MNAYTLSPRARHDLDQIWEYTAQRWGMEQADRYIRQIAGGCSDIANRRSIGQDVGYIRAGYYRYAIASHMVFYRWHDSQVEIVRILHRRMAVDRHL